MVDGRIQVMSIWISTVLFYHLFCMFENVYNKMLKTQTNETAWQQPPVCSGSKTKFLPQLLLGLTLNATPNLE